MRNRTRAPARTKRRALLLAGGAWIAVAATRSFAQSPKAVRRIAVLLPGTHAGYRSRIDAFHAELKRLGYVEGSDISIEQRWANDRTETLESLAAEIVSHNPAVILTGTSAGIAACKKATSTIPIVFASGASPVEHGFVSSLRRPGGNITGVLTHTELAAKMVEVAREALPQAQRLAILVHDSDPGHKSMLELIVQSAQRFKFDPVVVRVARAEEIDRAFNEIADRKADALYLPPLVFSISHRKRFIDRSLEARLPLLSTHHDTTVAGGLLSYGNWREENFRRAAALVDKILRGAKPGELPVERPERLDFVVNMKTAKAIGVSLSPAIMLRADRVIE